MGPIAVPTSRARPDDPSVTLPIRGAVLVGSPPHDRPAPGGGNRL
jgi:hypothetical protein